VASASVALTGSTSCNVSVGNSSFVKVVQPIKAVTPTGDETLKVAAAFTCTVSTVSNTPRITQLSGVFKAKIHLDTSSGPNEAQKCANFESSGTPVDVMGSNTHGYVRWHADTSSGSETGRRVPDPYSGTYGEDSSESMELDISATGSEVSGSFALSTINLDMLLSPSYNSCSVSGIVGKQYAVSGSTLTA
jgi:hypothetical protein